MKAETAIDVRRQLHRVLDNMRVDLDRVEILSAALQALSKPVPDYEPGFRHIQNLSLSTHKLG
ncbi:MAG: hypothetical protein WAM62_12900 [Pseudolabrys sp.]